MHIKQITSRVSFWNSKNEDEVIFDTRDSFDLNHSISFPEGTITKTLHIGNKITIEDTIYEIDDITLDIFSSETRLENNCQIIIYVNKID